MRLERRIRRVFGLKPGPRPAPAHQSPGGDGSLAHLGYPTLQQVDFFLDVPSLERWRAHRNLAFPSQCCICLQGAERYLPAYGYTGVFGMRGKAPLLEHIPHCDRHGRQDEAQLIVMLDSWSEAVCRVVLIGLSSAFLLETAKLNQVGDVPPPWRAFAGYEPHSSGWRQGNGEYWMGHVWRPFWAGLTTTERAHYLDRWAAPIEWRAWSD